jgi:hypothetical protein
MFFPQGKREGMGRQKILNCLCNEQDNLQHLLHGVFPSLFFTCSVQINPQHW